ncbi:MAG: hypothetical protein ACFE9Z_03350 [Promethearchaeota archaeon]
MKNSLFFFKVLLLTILVSLGIFITYYFFYFNQNYSSDSFEASLSWMWTISYFILFFYMLLFLIELRLYIIIFSIIVIFGTPTWIIIYALETFIPGFWFLSLTILRHLSAILSFSILAPGLTLIVMNYIKNNSNVNKSKKIFHNFHIHEGFVGLLFILIAVFLILIRYTLVQYEIFRSNLRIFLAIDMILLYLFLFFGAFLIFRDWRDMINFKLISKRETPNREYSEAIFYPINTNSINFFKSPKVLLYPFGILFSSIAVNIFIHGTDFLPEEIFSLNHETLVLIGIILSFFTGGIVGLDWYRLFARIYPELYRDFEEVLDNLRTQNSN